MPRPRPPHTRRPLAGFTLIELMITMAISTAVIAMTMDSLLLMTRGLNRIQVESAANDEAKLLNDFASTALVAVGGGSVRPWMALWVEDDHAGDGTDRISWATLVDTSLQCTIDSVSGNTLYVSVPDLTCCLTNDFDDRQVMVVGPESSRAWINRTVTAVDLTACSLSLAAGHAEILDLPADDESSYAEGVVAAVRTRTLWVDTAQNHLKMLEDFDVDGDVDTRILADRVYDLQGALGYDVDPWDWKVTDAQNNADEWLYNASGDTFAEDDAQGLSEAAVEELRMVAVAIMVGAQTGDGLATAPLQLLNGDTRQEDGLLLRGFASVIGLRNYDIMR